MVLWVWVVYRQGKDLPPPSEEEGDLDYNFTQRLVFEYVGEGGNYWYRRLVGVDNLIKRLEEGSRSPNAYARALQHTSRWVRCWGRVLRVGRVCGRGTAATIHHFRQLKGCGWLCRRCTVPTSVRGNPSTAAWAVCSVRTLTFYDGPLPLDASEQSQPPGSGSRDEHLCAVCFRGVVVPHLCLRFDEDEDGPPEEEASEEEDLSHYMVTPCDHVYHANCLYRCLLDRDKCPTCQQKVGWPRPGRGARAAMLEV